MGVCPEGENLTAVTHNAFDNSRDQDITVLGHLYHCHHHYFLDMAAL